MLFIRNLQNHTIEERFRGGTAGLGNIELLKETKEGIIVLRDESGRASLERLNADYDYLY